MLNFKLSGSSFAPRAGKLYEKTNIINVGDTERLISFASGIALYTLALGLKKNKLGKIFSYSGSYLLYRGVSGNCPIRAFAQKNKVKHHTQAVNIRSSFIVNAPKEKVYNTWQNLEKLPKFLKHIKKIKVLDDIHSHWILKTPGSIPTIEWDAEIIDQQKDHEISWRSMPGSMIENAGKITFADILNSTEVTIVISYRPPAGYIGSAVAQFLNPNLKEMVQEDLTRFKNHLEAKLGSHYIYDDEENDG